MGKVMEIADKKELKRIYDREYREKNREKIRARNKTYRHKYIDKIKVYLDANKETISQRNKEWYQQNKESRQEYSKKYKAENKEKLSERNKRRYQEKKEYLKAYNKQQYEKHKAKRLARRKEYVKENKEKISAYWGKRRASKRNRIPKWLSKEDLWIIQEAYVLANMRKKLFGINWHIDHIIPLRGVEVSGLHVPNNIQVVPAIWNLKKSNINIERFFA
jgi:SNF2 family DNA or RNA helicase